MSEDTFMMLVVFPLMCVFMGWLLWIILEWLRMRHKSQLQDKILATSSVPVGQIMPAGRGP